MPVLQRRICGRERNQRGLRGQKQVTEAPPGQEAMELQTQDFSLREGIWYSKESMSIAIRTLHPNSGINLIIRHRNSTQTSLTLKEISWLNWLMECKKGLDNQTRRRVRDAARSQEVWSGQDSVSLPLSCLGFSLIVSIIVSHYIDQHSSHAGKHGH